MSWAPAFVAVTFTTRRRPDAMSWLIVPTEMVRADHSSAAFQVASYWEPEPMRSQLENELLQSNTKISSSPAASATKPSCAEWMVTLAGPSRDTGPNATNAWYSLESRVVCPLPVRSIVVPSSLFRHQS